MEYEDLPPLDDETEEDLPEEEREDFHCERCGRFLPTDATICPRCGLPTPAGEAAGVTEEVAEEEAGDDADAKGAKGAGRARGKRGAWEAREARRDRRKGRRGDDDEEDPSGRERPGRKRAGSGRSNMGAIACAILLFLFSGGYGYLAVTAHSYIPSEESIDETDPGQRDEARQVQDHRRLTFILMLVGGGVLLGLAVLAFWQQIAALALAVLAVGGIFAASYWATAQKIEFDAIIAQGVFLVALVPTLFATWAKQKGMFKRLGRHRKRKARPAAAKGAKDAGGGRAGRKARGARGTKKGRRGGRRKRR